MADPDHEDVCVRVDQVHDQVDAAGMHPERWRQLGALASQLGELGQKRERRLEAVLVAVGLIGTKRPRALQPDGDQILLGLAAETPRHFRRHHPPVVAPPP